MATGDLAFACQCECPSCERYWIRTASRPWTGAIFLGLRFRDYHELFEPSAFYQPSDFNLTFSTARTNYGAFELSGEVGFLPSFALNFPIHPEDAVVFSDAPGAYVFTYDEATDPAYSHLTSFEAANDYSVRWVLDFTVAGNAMHAELTFGDWFSVTELEAILQEELEDARESFIDAVNGSPTYGLATYYDDTLLPADPRGFNSQSVGGSVGGFYDQCEISSVPLPVTFTKSNDASVGFASRCIDARADVANALRRSTIYVSGFHRVTTHPVEFYLSPSGVGIRTDTAATSCQEITVSGSYLIEPPTENELWRTWGENQQC